MSKAAIQKDSIKEYYGKIIKTSKDLKTSSCCTGDSLPAYVRSILKDIEPEILYKFYGCGSPLPLVLKDCTVLDLGCGTGRDVYIASKLVGKRGKVIGVDMTDEQLTIARKHANAQMKKFGYIKHNVEFKQGYIEDLKSLGIKNNSIDVVISNCVVNLSPDKKSVLSEIFRVLKPGGELYFSDVFAGRRVPTVHLTDPVLVGECLGGAMYTEDFRRILRDLGCPAYRTVSSRKIAINNTEIEQKVGMIDFYSMTVRAFKLHTLEDKCEDYGQVAEYLGTLDESPHRFILDDHHIFEANKPMLVCGNTASMLQETRFKAHFAVMGDRSNHYGLFPYGSVSGSAGKDVSNSSNACC